MTEVTHRLYEVVHQLLDELHFGRKEKHTLTYHSQLNRDLGLDSLGRAELLARIENEFDLVFPETLLTKSETLQDLIIGVLSAQGKSKLTDKKPADFLPLGNTSETPEHEPTLSAVLDWHVKNHPERAHVILLDEDDSNSTISYGHLDAVSRTIAGALSARGIYPGDRIALMLKTSADFLFTFFGIIRAGCVPVPIYPPAQLSQVAEHLKRQAGILDNAGVVALITMSETKNISNALKILTSSLHTICTVNDLKKTNQDSNPIKISSSSLALLQYTSGSTGEPKGVMLSHANLLENIRAIGKAISIKPSDVAVSWLPLYHDMGLIGAWLGALYFGVPCVLMSPLTFLTRPEKWLWAISRYRATISAAPNFGFELCVRKIFDKDISGLDLSSLRLLMNGAEPVSSQTIQKFSQRFCEYGFHSTAMTPVYGMAECALAVTIPQSNHAPRIDKINRRKLTDDGIAVPQKNIKIDKNNLEIVSCGQPLPGHQVRVVDSYGNELPDRNEGHLQFCGPSATSGYFENLHATAQLLDGKWRNSGDKGYVADGDVFVTGRSKDIIIRAGRNIYPHEIEEVVGNIKDVRKGCVAVFGCTDVKLGTECLIVVVETKETTEAQCDIIHTKIKQRLAQQLDVSVDEIVFVPPRSIPKTSSGKIRRHQTRNLYENGYLGSSYRITSETIRFMLRALSRLTRNILTQISLRIYGIYSLALIAIGALVGLPWILFLPTFKLRWKALQCICKAALKLLGIKINTYGLDNITTAHRIIVANHTSYLDAFLLCSILPNETTFLVKAELRKHCLIGPVLRRFGVIFVERVDVADSINDNQLVTDEVQHGKRVLYFPEGTFSRKSGLEDFRLGAFIVSTTTGVPILPIALQGARSVLRDGSARINRGSIVMRIGADLFPKGNDFSAALKLREKSREWILEHCGEPDLSNHN